MDDTSKLEFVRGTLDVLVLKALVWGPLHGYAITSLIRGQSDDALIVEEGTLYPALWRLESKGFLNPNGASRITTGKPNSTASRPPDDDICAMR